MTKTFTVQAAALALAAVVTFSLLGSVGGVANQQYGNVVATAKTDTMATQQVVIVGKRIPRA